MDLSERKEMRISQIEVLKLVAPVAGQAWEQVANCTNTRSLTCPGRRAASSRR